MKKNLSGLYIYTIEVSVMWSYHSTKEEAACDDSEEYVVAANNFDEAYKKVCKIALSPSRKWIDKNDDGVSNVCIPLDVVDVISSCRGEHIDG